MFDRFHDYIKEKQLFESNQRVLLAVSGGIDSMVLLYLFEKSGFEYGIVHCNFQLRSDESDGDEEFVKQQVQIHGVPSFYETFETEEYAHLNGISIEMAARELRYQFFEEVRSVNNYDFIATAHHQDDFIETFFLNLSRKTGIKGLTGIKEKSGKIIRPLLFADRNEIEDFARINFIDFREDSSNNEVVYQRNFLRNKILPLFSEMNPAFKKNVLASISNLKNAEQLYDHFIHIEVDKVVTKDETGIRIDIEHLRTTPFPQLLLLEVLSEYHFNPTVVDEIYRSLDAESGRRFYSPSHCLVKDRKYLFVSALNEDEEKLFYIEENDMELFVPIEISIERIPVDEFEIIKSANVACLDLDLLEFPLLIRKWQQGDYFQPLGMTGFKKVSDFFIDEKVPLHEKENTWIMCSGNKIVWIMGHRIDNRFKITPLSKQVLKIEIM